MTENVAPEKWIEFYGRGLMGKLELATKLYNSVALSTPEKVIEICPEKVASLLMDQIRDHEHTDPKDLKNFSSNFGAQDLTDEECERYRVAQTLWNKWLKENDNE